MTQTAINLVAMASVDSSHRPNAVAFLTLSSHLLGDVPLPVILGLIKDKLAPACRVGASGEFDDAEQCKEQEPGVRQSLAISYAWVLWSLLFFELSRRFALREIRKMRRKESNTLLLQEEEATLGEGRDFQYYHAQFDPTASVPSSGKDESSPLHGTAVTAE